MHPPIRVTSYLINAFIFRVHIPCFRGAQAHRQMRSVLSHI